MNLLPALQEITGYVEFCVQTQTMDSSGLIPSRSCDICNILDFDTGY